MPSWNDLLQEFTDKADDTERTTWLSEQQRSYFDQLSGHLGQRDGTMERNVLYYGSAFLQKPVEANLLSISHEDINGFMSVIFGMDWSKNLTLILHTPGGSPTAAQTIVEYLRAKFTDLEVIIPAMAMSAGTMISLASDRIIMGRQSQLGPIDPQLTLAGRLMSARAVVEQFERATREILENPATARVWAPITQSLGPALLQDAQNALDYSQDMVAAWLARWMFKEDPDAVERAKQVASHFNDASRHKSHGRRIDLAEAAQQGLNVARLEDDQALQEFVLTVYHLLTIVFEHTPATKLIIGSNGRAWIKNQAIPMTPPAQMPPN
jgi:ClpP class serine protease